MTAGVVAAADLALLKAGVVNGPGAVALLVGAEAAVTGAALLMAARAAKKAAAKAGSTITTGQAISSVLPKRIARFVQLEAGMFATLWQAVRKRPPKLGTEHFTGRKGTGLLMGAGIGGTVVEAAAVHVLVPWPPAQAALACINAYGVVWLTSMWAGFRTRPHVVAPDGVAIRYSFLKNAHVPMRAIESVKLETNMSSEAWFKTDAGGAYHAPVGGQTNITLRLNQPIPHLDGATEVRLFADDPSGFMRSIGRHIT